MKATDSFATELAITYERSMAAAGKG